MEDFLKYLLTDKKIACSICGAAVFDEGKTIAKNNGYKAADLKSLQKIIDNTCPHSTPDFYLTVLGKVALMTVYI